MITDFRLEVFVTAARVLSFTRAAEELNISQPAVTKHIKELERLLSVALFKRGGSRITLTEDGERLLPLAKTVLHGYLSLVDTMSTARDDYAGRLRIGASTTIAQYILPKLLAKFRRDYPSIDVILTGGNSEEILRELENEGIDIALVEDAHTSMTFHYETFAEDDIVLISSNKGARKIDIESIKNLRLILRENGSGTLDVIVRELESRKITRRMLNVEMQIGSSEGIMRYLMNSKCYAFISRAAANDYLQRNDLYITEIEGFTINRSLRFATLHGHSLRLADLFTSYCSNHKL